MVQMIETPSRLAAWAALLTHLDAYCARKRTSDDEVAHLAGLTIAEFDADTTAPDPGEEEQAR